MSGAPAVRCALETALLDIGAQQQGMPLSRWLARDAAGRVAVNAACGCLDEGFAVRLAEALAKGYRVLKIKMGLFPLDEELKYLQRLQLPGGVNLRLDANRAWSFDQAAQAIEACRSVPVESLEEPLQAPDLAVLRVLQQQAPFPLALDESLTDRFVDTPAEELPVQRLVMKPTTMGGIRRVVERAQQAKRAGIDTVVTSTLETSVGLRAVAHVAAALNNELAHGIGTAEWLENPDPALCPRRGVLTMRELL
ncbi:MAG TPA: o-succinylbenzoate synthase [Gammaproteobacteria bacterium]|nr:o-succinylbenzoate synthase [Gammaproteobacteria bacterium]